MSSEANVRLEIIRRLVRRASETDYLMPLWLPFLPAIIIIMGLILTIIGVLFAVSEIALKYGLKELPPEAMSETLLTSTSIGIFVSIYILAVIMGVIIQIYVLYKWINRRNEHFKRTHSLYKEIIEFIKTVSGKEKPAKIVSLENTIRDMEVNESEKSPIIWIILTIILGFLIFYVYHFLNSDLHKHERRETFFAEDLSIVLKDLGASRLPRKPIFEMIPKRNTLLYLLLTIITFGLFGLYWIYTLTKDPNEHFKIHRIWEEEILMSLESLIKPS